MSAETRVPADGTRYSLLGCPIDALTVDQTVERIVELMRQKDPCSQLSLNAAKVVAVQRDERLRAILARASIVSADGQSVVWAGKLLGVPIPERVAGIELFARLLRALEASDRSVYFLGARAEILEQAVESVRAEHPALRIAGFHHGHFPPGDDERVASLVATSAPDALFVGMSSPRKEFWIDAYQKLMGATFAMGVGGSFDVLAGLTKRAPRALQRLGLEWAYRTAQEPRRLAGRYARTNAVFVRLVAAEAMRKHTGRAK